MQTGRLFDRRLFASVLVALALFVVACGGSDDESGDGGGGGAEAPAAEQEPGWTQEAEYVDCEAPDTEAEGCVGEKQPGTYEALPSGSASKDWNICVSVPHLKDAYWLAVNYGAGDEAKRAGVQMEFFDAGGYTELPKQLSQLDNCVAQGADAVVVGGISYDGLNAKVEEFVGSGIPVVDIMNGISSPEVNAHALVNFYDMGAAAGEYLAGLGEPLKVAWFPGPPGAGWVESANDGFQDAVKGSQVEVVVTKYGDTGKEVQLGLVENALQTYPDLDYVAGTAVTAEAAVTAVKERGLEDQVKIIADYMIPTTFDLIEQGSVACAPTDQPVTQARMGVDMAVRLLEEEELSGGFARVGPKVKLICGAGSEGTDNVGDFDPETTFAPEGYEPVASGG